MAARLHSRVLSGVCNEGALMIVIMMTRLLRKAKAHNGMLTAATKDSLIHAAGSSLAGMPNHQGTLQLTVAFTFILFCEKSKIFRCFHPLKTIFMTLAL